MNDDTDLSYSAAATELEAILSALERETVDIDDLEARVARATELIRFCRERLTRTQLEVERIVTDLSADDFGPDGTGDPRPEGGG